MRYPDAVWRPVVNRSVGAMRRPIMGLVLHHSVGPLDAAEARFNNPTSSASAHFGNPLAQQEPMRQWVDTDDVAWAQVDGNWTGWVSVENESLAFDVPETLFDDVWAPLNEPQLARVAALFRWLHDTEGVPLQVTDDPNVPGLAYHSMNPPAWGLTGCPGQPIIDQRPEIVARALGAPIPAPPANLEELEPMYVLHHSNGNIAVLTDLSDDVYIAGQVGVTIPASALVITCGDDVWGYVLADRKAKREALGKADAGTTPAAVDFGPLLAALTTLSVAVDGVRGALPPA